jgi:osmotically-inducible protein OsmY
MAPNDQQAALEEAASDIAARLESHGIYIGVEVREGRLHLEGAVDSVENRDAARDIANVVAEGAGLHVQDSLEIMSSVPDNARPEERD